MLPGCDLSSSSGLAYSVLLVLSTAIYRSILWAILGVLRVHFVCAGMFAPARCIRWVPIAVHRYSNRLVSLFVCDSIVASFERTPLLIAFAAFGTLAKMFLCKTRSRRPHIRPPGQTMRNFKRQTANSLKPTTLFSTHFTEEQDLPAMWRTASYYPPYLSVHWLFRTSILLFRSYTLRTCIWESRQLVFQAS